ncbi:hypothetical protein [Paenibacillus eucommiae]|uniref:Transposase/invertase (TIGR01784 family) n=1 Tax=Paenibacillus eucommiae TaxID=1355755 RepID=A0ABS4IMP2_9BACL|nr:hypothetical protein [Paenibacillus eucommiae]MBP1988435.1 putative transposase/invertase (TIGR01784 family) [Paenibacillus eucommiae]
MVKTLIDPRIKAEGIKEGKVEGIKEGKIEVARNLLALKADIDMIQKATGLSSEEIKQLHANK